MKAAKEDLLSVPHFACFGGIVFAFARLEYLIQVTMGAGKCRAPENPGADQVALLFAEARYALQLF